MYIEGMEITEALEYLGGPVIVRNGCRGVLSSVCEDGTVTVSDTRGMVKAVVPLSEVYPV